MAGQLMMHWPLCMLMIGDSNRVLMVVADEFKKDE